MEVSAEFHKLILQMSGNGRSQVNIAAETGIARSTVGNSMKPPEILPIRRLKNSREDLPSNCHKGPGRSSTLCTGNQERIRGDSRNCDRCTDRPKCHPRSRITRTYRTKEAIHQPQEHQG